MRVGPRRLLVFSLTLFTATSAMLLLVDLNTSTLWIVAILFLRGVAMAFTFVPLQAATFATIRPEDTGRASSIFNTTRQVASSFGVAILATVLISRTNERIDSLGAAGGQVQEAAVRHASLLAFHDAFIASAVLAAIGILFTLLIKDADAASTMQPSPVAIEPEQREMAEEPTHVHIQRRPIALNEPDGDREIAESGPTAAPELAGIEG
jgi:MFS family permease